MLVERWRACSQFEEVEVGQYLESCYLWVQTLQQSNNCSHSFMLDSLHHIISRWFMLLIFIPLCCNILMLLLCGCFINREEQDTQAFRRVMPPNKSNKRLDNSWHFTASINFYGLWLRCMSRSLRYKVTIWLVISTYNVPCFLSSSVMIVFFFLKVLCNMDRSMFVYIHI